MRFETAPEHQLQIDFGEKCVPIAGVRTKVHLFVAVFGYSRRIYVRASLSQRQDDWREGLASAFRCFGGLTHKIVDPHHFAGIYRAREDATVVASSPIGRSLDVYADVVGGAA